MNSSILEVVNVPIVVAVTSVLVTASMEQRQLTWHIACLTHLQASMGLWRRLAIQQNFLQGCWMVELMGAPRTLVNCWGHSRVP